MNQLKFEIIKHPDYKIVAINRIWGGPVSAELLLMHCCNERRDLPHSVTVNLDTGDEVERDEVKRDEVERHEGKLVREAYIGLTITPRAAISIGQWLIAHAEDMLKNQPVEDEIPDAAVTIQ